MKTINCIGKMCPIPTIMVKKEINNCENETILVQVDNVIATENLQKMSKELGLLKGFQVEKVNEEFYNVTIVVGNGKSQEKINTSLQNIIVISSNAIGEVGEIGEKLLESFIYSLTELENAPKYILFYNKGVFITTKNEKAIEDLNILKEKGTQILSCGLCLDYYNLTLKVGDVTNMYKISELLMSSEKVISVV